MKNPDAKILPQPVKPPWYPVPACNISLIFLQAGCVCVHADMCVPLNVFGNDKRERMRCYVEYVFHSILRDNKSMPTMQAIFINTSMEIEGMVMHHYLICLLISPNVLSFLLFTSTKMLFICGWCGLVVKHLRS